MGMSKPHQLASQNDEIKKMLGMKKESSAIEGSDKKPRRKDADGNSIISKSTLQSQGGPVKAVRAGSTIRSNATATNISVTNDTKSVVSRADIQDHWKEAIVTGLEQNLIDIDSDNASDFEVDAVETLMSSIQLEDQIKEVNKTAKRVLDGHKHSFLHRYMEHTETELEKSKRVDQEQSEMLKMPDNVRRRQPRSKAMYVGD